MKRRKFLGFLASAGLFAIMAKSILAEDVNPNHEIFEVQMSEEEWKKKLTNDQFTVLRKHGTEAPFTSSLNDEKRHGTFYCAGCHNALFNSSTKYNSGTGWPSFYQPLAETSVGTTTDHIIGYARTEVHCAKCGGHLGHVFDDGPQPTGKRYCMNGVAMQFEENKA